MAACLALRPVGVRTVATGAQDPPAASRPAVTADGLVYVSGITSNRPVPDSIASQTKTILEPLVTAVKKVSSVN